VGVCVGEGVGAGVGVGVGVGLVVGVGVGVGMGEGVEGAVQDNFGRRELNPTCPKQKNYVVLQAMKLSN
jgi:hypothetical protein